MTTVIHHTTVVTGDRDPSIHFDAAIAIENDLIAAIGPSDEVMARFPNAEGVDGRGKLVMPGFANCHTHFVRILARGISEDQSAPNRPPFTRKGRIPFPSLRPEQRAVMARLAALEALRSGTTAAMDITNNIEDYAEAIVATGLRLGLGRAGIGPGQRSSRRRAGRLRGRPGTRRQGLTADCGSSRQVARRGKRPRHGRGCSLRSRHGFPSALTSVARVARKTRHHRHHSPESVLGRSRGDQEQLRNASHGVLGPPWVSPRAARCRSLPVHDAGRRKNSRRFGGFSQLQPGGRGAFGNSPRVTDLEASGCRIALGTDEFTEDMVQVLRSAVLIERLRLKESERPRPEEAMLWGTVNGYRALNLKGCGFLQVGSKADLIVVGTRHAHLVPTLRPVAVFVYQGQARDVESVIVDGRWLMRDGKCSRWTRKRSFVKQTA